MTKYQQAKCNDIIAAAKIKAGAIGSRTAALKSILTDLTIDIGYVFGYDVSRNMPSDLRISIFSYSVGSSANKLLTGWIPIGGKIIDHASAALMVDEMGKDAINFFDSL